MTIDINELRRKVNSTDTVDHIDLHANIKPLLSEMIGRLEAAEKERDEFKRACFAHISDNSLLLAKLVEMEQQELVAIQHQVPSVNFRGECVGYSEWKDGKGLEHWPHRTLYALPGAKGEEK